MSQEIDFSNVSPKSKINYIKVMMTSPGWQVLLHQWNGLREKIIAAGKKARMDESKMKMWSKLEGFDEAVLVAELLVRELSVLEEIEKDMELEESDA